MTPLVAALPMYDWPEVRAETDRTWAALRDRLRAQDIPAPEHLARRNADLPPVPGGVRDAQGRPVGPDPAALPPDEFHLPTLWRHPALLLAQTCWGPMEQGLAADVAVAGQGDYSAFEGGKGELYSSAILMRSEAAAVPRSDGASPRAALPGTLHPPVGRGLTDLPSGPTGLRAREREDGDASRMRGSADGTDGAPASNVADLLDCFTGKRLAYNGPDSMSGYIALRRDLEAAGESLAIFSSHIETGAHRASVLAVAEGRADVCAVDCRTWALARRLEPRAAKLAVVGWTAKRLGLPFITAHDTSPTVVQTLREALHALSSRASSG